jgi:hypothetical protein
MTKIAEISRILDPKELSLPSRPRVLEVKAEPYTDANGIDSLLVWVILDNDTPDRDRTWKKLKPIEEAIGDALLQEGIELFPYVWYRTKAEFKKDRLGL